MELPVVRCSNCKKTVPISQAILVQGKAFCSEKCQKESNFVQTPDMGEQEQPKEE